MKYKNGLVIGKFMPVHNGHIALIRYAKTQCEFLTVLVGALKGEPIPGPLRFSWMQKIFADDKDILINYTEEDLPSSQESSQEVSRVWAAYCKRRYPHTDLIISYEAYGAYLAQFMGIESVCYDQKRERYPVSGTAIRENPFHWWDSIPQAVRPYFIKTVCIYGPESTGKTVLTQQLAQVFSTSFVPEMARLYIGDRKPIAEDIPIVAQLHAQEILKQKQIATKLLFVDSDLITTQIYAQHLFGQNPVFPDWVTAANRYDLYLLSDIDIPWEEDIQRDTGNDRLFFYNWFRRELETRSIPYEKLSGLGEDRLKNAIRIICKAFPQMNPI